MGGENEMNIGLTIEILFDFIQQLVFIGFLYLFFDKPKNKLKNILGFSISVLILFAMAIYFTFHEMTFNHLDSIITLVVMVLYAVIFLKAELYLRILIPIAAFALNLLVAYGNAVLLTSLGKRNFEDVVLFSTTFRYTYLIIGNLVYIGLLVIMLLTAKKKINIRNSSEMISVIVIPTLVYSSLIAALLLFEVIGFNDSVLVYLAVIIISIAIISVLFWVLLLRTSKANEIRTEMLLSKQREELYKNSVVVANAQIEKISAVKHDMMNNLMSFSALITDGEYEKAKRLCDEYSEKLSAANTPVHTNNPVLNAIVNIEIEKTEANHIDFTYEINDELLFVSDSDIISIIGNLCDNAIEYLITVPEDKRQMYLAITIYRDYCCITSKNTILSSVINANPDLKSSKKDLTFHGKGTKILKDIAKKYSGELIYSEEDGWFIISAIIRNKN